MYTIEFVDATRRVIGKTEVTARPAAEVMEFLGHKFKYEGDAGNTYVYTQVVEEKKEVVENDPPPSDVVTESKK